MAVKLADNGQGWEYVKPGMEVEDFKVLSAIDVHFVEEAIAVDRGISVLLDDQDISDIAFVAAKAIMPLLHGEQAARKMLVEALQHEEKFRKKAERDYESASLTLKSRDRVIDDLEVKNSQLGYEIDAKHNKIQDLKRKSDRLERREAERMNQLFKRENKEDIDALRRTIQELKGTITELEETVTDLRAMNDELQGEKEQHPHLNEIQPRKRPWRKT